MATFFITGATGAVGREVVNSLLEADQSVIAASRHPKQSQAQFGDRVKAVHFDFEDSNTFSEAMGTDGVFILGPPMYPNLFELLVPFVDYLQENGPKRVVYLSANGMEHLSELPFHAQMEEKLRGSDLDWRVVRPGFFMQNFGNYERENIEQRKMIFVPAGEEKTAFISTKDIGAAIATLLTQDEHQHQTYVLTGSEAYSYFDAADMLSDIRGEKITYPNPDEETYRQVLADAGAPDFVADYMIPVYGMIKKGHVKDITDDVEKLTGQKPEPLKAALTRDFGK